VPASFVAAIASVAATVLARVLSAVAAAAFCTTMAVVDVVTDEAAFPVDDSALVEDALELAVGADALSAIATLSEAA
jgi:hypothetical protein